MHSGILNLSQIALPNMWLLVQIDHPNRNLDTLYIITKF